MYFADYQQGDSGSGVTDLQNYLIELGYPITADGQYGPQTAAAVTHFQAAYGAADTAPRGVAGPGTLIAIAQARGESWRQADFAFVGTAAPPHAAAAAPASAPTAPSAPMSLPFGLTPLKVGLLAVIGVAAWKFSK